MLDETLASSEDGRRYILFDVKPVGLVVESWGSLLGIAVGDRCWGSLLGIRQQACATSM